MALNSKPLNEQYSQELNLVNLKIVIFVNFSNRLAESVQIVEVNNLPVQVRGFYNSYKAVHDILG